MCIKLTLQQRAKVAGTMDVILAAISLITGSIDLNKLYIIKQDGESTAVELKEADAALILLYIIMSISVIKMIMGVVLWQGATQRNYGKCRAWLIVSLILWLLHVMDFTTKLAIGTFVLASTISNSFAILIRILVMFIIYSFMKELRSEAGPVTAQML